MGITVRGKWLILAASTFLILALFGPAGAQTAVDKIHFLIRVVPAVDGTARHGAWARLWWIRASSNRLPSKICPVAAEARLSTI